MTRVASVVLAAMLCQGLALAESAPEPLGAALGVGERRAVLVHHVDEAYAVPEGTVDVACVGPRTVVVTGRKAGEVELRVVTNGREWSTPITVVGDRAPARGDDAPVEGRVTRSAPPRARIVPVPPPQVPDPVGDELVEADFLPRDAGEPAPLIHRAVPSRDALDDALHAAPPVRETDSDLPRLTGILRTAQGPVALLDGAPVGVGEKTGSYTVVQVEEDTAVLDCRGRTVTLRLSNR